MAKANPIVSDFDDPLDDPDWVAEEKRKIAKYRNRHAARKQLRWVRHKAAQESARIADSPYLDEASKEAEQERIQEEIQEAIQEVRRCEDTWAVDNPKKKATKRKATKRKATKKKPVRRRRKKNPSDITLRIPYSVLNVYQRYWYGQGDDLYAVLSRRGNSTGWVTLDDVSEDEFERLRETTEEIIEKSDDKGEVRTAVSFKATLEDSEYDLDELVDIAKRHSGVVDAKVKSYEDGEIHVDIDDYMVHMFRYGDGTWWWQRGYGRVMDDEDDTGKPFKEALKDAMRETNPRKKKASKRKATKKKTTKRKSTKKRAPRKPKTLKGRVKRAEKKVGGAAKRAGKRIEKDAKAAGSDVKKFAKTKTGYGTAGALLGAAVGGPLLAGIGVMGGAALHDNPGNLGDIYEVEVEYWDNDKLGSEWENIHEMVTTVKYPTREYGTEGWPMLQRMHGALKKEMIKRELLVENPRKRKTTKKKPTRRRKNPSAADHERVGMDALANSEKYHKRFEKYGRTNDLLDTYQWLVIAHEELKYSGKAEPRVQARDGLKEVRRQMLRVIK